MPNLPFLKPKSISGSIMTTKVRAPDSPSDEKAPENQANSGLLAGAQDFIRAVQADDAKGAADAFQAMYDMCQSPQDMETQGETE